MDRILEFKAENDTSVQDEKTKLEKVKGFKRNELIKFLLENKIQKEKDKKTKQQLELLKKKEYKKLDKKTDSKLRQQACNLVKAQISRNKSKV